MIDKYKRLHMEEPNMVLKLFMMLIYLQKGKNLFKNIKYKISKNKIFKCRIF
jgi:hypothetical protein